MDGIRTAVRWGVFGAFAVLVVFSVLSATDEADAQAFALTARDGSPMAVPTLPGIYEAVWSYTPVLVFVEPTARLDGVEAVRGEGEATASVAVPGKPELRLFALSARSTHLGCTVGFNAELGASRDVEDYDGDDKPDGRIMDPCSQFQWDAFHRGTPVAGPPELQRLPVLDVHIRNGFLFATEFDGDPRPEWTS